MEVLDESPVLLRRQYDFWQWLADYYLCTLGDVYKAALPSGMKLESETLVVLNPEFEALQPLSEKDSVFLICWVTIRSNVLHNWKSPVE